MKQNRWLSAALLSAASGVATVPAVAASFRKIADTAFVAPDGLPIFVYSQPQLGGGSVVFMGATGAPDAYIFRAPVTGGSVTKLVDGTTKVPGGIGAFTGSHFGYFAAYQPPGCTPPAAGASSAVFVGRDAAGNEGLYSVPLTGGTLTRLADRTTAVPGGPVGGHAHFDAGYSPCNFSVSGNVVVFDAGLQGVYSVQTNGTQLTRVADGNTPATPPPTPVNSFSQPSISGSTVTYIGSTVFGPYGVYAGATSGLGQALVRTRNSPQFNQFSYPIAGSGWIDFAARLAGNNPALYRMTTSGAALQTVANLNSAVPPNAPGTRFVSIGSSSNNDGYAPAGNLTVFHAETASGSTIHEGLFTSCRGTIAKVVADGDVLNGLPVAPLDGASNLLAVPGTPTTGYYEAMRVGVSRYQGIYVATIPAC